MHHRSNTLEKGRMVVGPNYIQKDVYSKAAMLFDDFHILYSLLFVTHISLSDLSLFGFLVPKNLL